MNPAAIDLIHKLLCKDPQRRITVSDAKVVLLSARSMLGQCVLSLVFPASNESLCVLSPETRVPEPDWIDSVRHPDVHPDCCDAGGS